MTHRAPRNAGLVTALRLYREYREGLITAEQALETLVFLELEPKERLILHHVTEHPDATAAQIAEDEVMNHVHVSTVLKRLTDLGLMERNEYIDFQGRYFAYRVKKPYGVQDG